MGEWRRIFGDRKRLRLLAILSLLCAGAFLLSLPAAIQPGEFERISLCNRYASLLTGRWRNTPLAALPAQVEAEYTRRENVDAWYYAQAGYEDPEAVIFDSEEAALASVADIPGLAEDYFANNGNLYTTLQELEEEVDYLTGYADYLDAVQENAARQSKIRLFGEEGSFSRRNLEKTAQDFSALQGVEVSFGNSRGIEKWLDFDLGNYFHLFGILLFVMAFLEERKKGLWNVVRTCKGGRTRLWGSRLGILAAGSALCTALFCAVPLLLSLGIFGGWEDLGRSLQSIPAFQTCTLRLTVLQWLMQYFLVKIASGAMIGMLLWCLLSSLTNPQSFLLVLGATLAAEFTLYEVLPVQSALNVVKYLNIFSYVHTPVMYTRYLNVNLFGYPVGIRALLLIALPVLCLLLLGWSFALERLRHPEGNRDHIGKLTALWNRLMDAVRARMPLGGWEAYKMLILEWGVVILLAVGVVAQNMDFTAFVEPLSSNAWYEKYLNDMEGPIDDGTDDYFIRARSYAETAEDSGTLLSALDLLERETAENRARAEERGYAPWILNRRHFDSVYGDSSLELQRGNAAVAILLVAFCCAGLGAYERQSGAVTLLRSLKRGRRSLFAKKAVIASLLAALVWAVLSSRELSAFLKICPPEALCAPVQNLPDLAAFPLFISIRQYLWLLYAVRLVMLILTAWVALLLSHLSSGIRRAYVLCIGVLGLPSLFFSFGMDALKWLCPVLPVSSAELLNGIQSGNVITALPWLLWLAVGVGALLAARRKWTKGYFGGRA